MNPLLGWAFEIALEGGAGEPFSAELEYELARRFLELPLGVMRPTVEPPS